MSTALATSPEDEFVLWGDGIHDDTQAIQAALAGKRVRDKVTGDYVSPVNGTLVLPRTYLLSRLDLFPEGARGMNLEIAHAVTEITAP